MSEQLHYYNHRGRHLVLNYRVPYEVVLEAVNEEDSRR